MSSFKRTVLYLSRKKGKTLILFLLYERQEVVAVFVKKVYAYKDKGVEAEWNFSIN